MRCSASGHVPHHSSNPHNQPNHTLQATAIWQELAPLLGSLTDGAPIAIRGMVGKNAERVDGVYRPSPSVFPRKNGGAVYQKVGRADTFLQLLSNGWHVCTKDAHSTDSRQAFLFGTFAAEVNIETPRQLAPGMPYVMTPLDVPRKEWLAHPLDAPPSQLQEAAEAADANRGWWHPRSIRVEKVALAQTDGTDGTKPAQNQNQNQNQTHGPGQTDAWHAATKKQRLRRKLRQRVELSGKTRGRSNRRRSKPRKSSSKEAPWKDRLLQRLQVWDGTSLDAVKNRLPPLASFTVSEVVTALAWASDLKGSLWRSALRGVAAFLESVRPVGTEGQHRLHLVLERAFDVLLTPSQKDSVETMRMAGGLSALCDNLARVHNDGVRVAFDALVTHCKDAFYLFIADMSHLVHSRSLGNRRITAWVDAVFLQLGGTGEKTMPFGAFEHCYRLLVSAGGARAVEAVLSAERRRRPIGARSTPAADSTTSGAASASGVRRYVETCQMTMEDALHPVLRSLGLQSQSDELTAAGFRMVSELPLDGKQRGVHRMCKGVQAAIKKGVVPLSRAYHPPRACRAPGSAVPASSPRETFMVVFGDANPPLLRPATPVHAPSVLQRATR